LNPIWLFWPAARNLPDLLIANVDIGFSDELKNLTDLSSKFLAIIDEPNTYNKCFPSGCNFNPFTIFPLYPITAANSNNFDSSW